MLIPGSARKKNNWFEERRSLFVKNMLKEFYETMSRFRELYEHYTKTQEITFAEIDRLVGRESSKGLLWSLKDRCHQLWREADPESEMTGCLLDWLMGSIFHEAMKLKENIYMLEYYGPLADKMRQKNSAATVNFCGIECRQFLERTRTEITREMENLGFLFGRANYLLRNLIIEQAKNPLLVRFLFEHHDVAENLWSETLENLFSDMYASQPEAGFCLAARSYKEGDWEAMATKAYSKALQIKPDCDEALRGLFHLKQKDRKNDRKDF